VLKGCHIADSCMKDKRLHENSDLLIAAIPYEVHLWRVRTSIETLPPAGSS
jgi:hypothetical protein